ncbi:LysR family transcriptional regulator [Burkholderiaceae bacterium]|nr:LysR family transcriptional regulator [Burkholderiaceae bacterium]
MQSIRNALSSENLHLLATIAESGSLAAAARRLGVVPSALSYRLRRMEELLDVLLIDRSTRRAQLTPAGQELLRVSVHLLAELEAVALRVRRVAHGWESQLVLVADNLVATEPLFDLLEQFYALNAPTRIKLRVEVLSGVTESLASGHSDLAIGVFPEQAQFAGIQHAPLGKIPFVFAVARHHPLANAPEPLSDEQRGAHRVVTVADSVSSGQGLTHNVLLGQDTLTVPNMALKLAAQMAGLGCGYLPESLARAHIASGALVPKQLAQPGRVANVANVAYAWRTPTHGPIGPALQWWLDKLKHRKIRAALTGS